MFIDYKTQCYKMSINKLYLNYRINATLIKIPEKAMATHSNILAWRIPGMGEPGGLLSMGSHRVGHD